MSWKNSRLQNLASNMQRAISFDRTILALRLFALHCGGPNMFALQLRKRVEVVLVAVATLALTAGNSSAVVINFEELADGSIQVTGDLNVNKPASETFRISAPNCNCGADATLGQIG